LAVSQPKQNLASVNATKPLEVIPQSKLQINRVGFPIEIAELRYNDTFLLALQPSEVNSTYVFFEPKNNSLDFLKHHVFTVYFSKSMLKPDEVIKLVSVYGFSLKDNMLSKAMSQQAIEWKQQKLPPYLSFSIEEIKIK
jgi:hypothetical protein